MQQTKNIKLFHKDVLTPARQTRTTMQIFEAIMLNIEFVDQTATWLLNFLHFIVFLIYLGIPIINLRSRNQFNFNKYFTN